MARHNPSGPRRGRRGSTPESRSSDKSGPKKSSARFPGKATGGGRSFGKPRSGNTHSTGNRADARFSEKGAGRSKDDGRGFSSERTPGSDRARKNSSSPSTFGKRPYKKFESEKPNPHFESGKGAGHDEKKPFGRRSTKDFTGKKYDRREISEDRKKRAPGGAEARSTSGQRYNTGKGSAARGPRQDTHHAGTRRPGADSYAPRREGPKKAHESTGTQLKQAPPADTGTIRLNKYIANSGVCSRREADELIKMGLISVNGKTITELGYKVNRSDEIRHESKVLHAEKPVYILLNKPKGFLTTTADPQERNTVMHLIANHVKERVYPVGRLDRNTTGLLLLTNDGDLAEKLMHPSYNVRKVYKVDLDRPLTKTDAQRVAEGVKLEEGIAIVDDLAILSDDRKTVGLEIHIGWNRVVRRIFESLEYKVMKLDRSAYAGLTKKDIGRGEWRFLKKEELVHLKHFK